MKILFNTSFSTKGIYSKLKGVHKAKVIKAILS